MFMLATVSYASFVENLGLELFHTHLRHMFLLARVSYASSVLSFPWAWNCTTCITVNCFCWQLFHMHLLFKVLDLELFYKHLCQILMLSNVSHTSSVESQFHTHLRQMFMLARVSYASSVQNLRLGTVSHAFSFKSLRLGTVSHAFPSNDHTGKSFLSMFSSFVVGLEQFHTHLHQMFMLSIVSHASFVESLVVGTVLLAYPSKVHADKRFICIFGLTSSAWYCFTHISFQCLYWQEFPK